MPSRPLPRPGRGTLLSLALTAALTLVASNAAQAALIPAPGPWPMNVTGATNPLAGTAFAFNGSNATPNAELRVWLPSGHHHLNAITRTVGQDTVIRGRLRNRDTKRSIGGATLTVAVQNVYSPTEWTAVTTTRTNRKGVFRTVVGPGYHRRVALLYYPNISAPAPVYSRRLLIRAKSRVALQRPFRKARAYRFDGQVSAGVAPVPTAGLLVALQVRNRTGNWVSARLRRTNPQGRFRIRYTFPTSARLTVRIAVPSQNGWALYAGYSPKRLIHP